MTQPQKHLHGLGTKPQGCIGTNLNLELPSIPKLWPSKVTLPRRQGREPMCCHLNIKCHYQFQSSPNTHTHATHAHVLEPGSQLVTLIVWKAVEPLGCGVAQRKWVTGRQVSWVTGRSHLCPGLWLSDPQDVSRLCYHRPACLPSRMDCVLWATS